MRDRVSSLSSGRAVTWRVSTLKPRARRADGGRMSVDTTYLERWTRLRAARIQARGTVPASWRNDPRPKMQFVTESYIELRARIDDVRTATLVDDDR